MTEEYSLQARVELFVAFIMLAFTALLLPHRAQAFLLNAFFGLSPEAKP